MPQKKFLIIKSTGNGFWHEMHIVLTQLLAAEMLEIIPIVDWRENCLYGSNGQNAFERFFLPVSGYKADEAASLPDTLELERCPDIEEIARSMGQNSPYYGLGRRDLFSAMLKKYIRLREEITAIIDSFYNAHMKEPPLIAVHIRGSDKILEISHLHEINQKYPAEIDRLIAENPSARIFLMTDCRDILEEYKQMYGDIIIHTDCHRVLKNDAGSHYQQYPDNMTKGIEIIRDTWLAAKCDYFIGNGHSNVSRAISELKDWNDSRITLLY